MQQHEFLNIQVDHVSSDASVACLFTKSLRKSMFVITCEEALACAIYQNYKFVRHQGESTHKCSVWCVVLFFLRPCILFSPKRFLFCWQGFNEATCYAPYHIRYATQGGVLKEGYFRNFRNVS